MVAGQGRHMNLLLAADIVFTIVHTVIILLNLLGWAWHRTRKIQAVALVLTLVSWFGSGYWYGWGFCILTDWHWTVLEQRGIAGLPQSYVQWLVERLTGLPISGRTADISACLGLLFGIGGAIMVRVVNWNRNGAR